MGMRLWGLLTVAVLLCDVAECVRLRGDRLRGRSGIVGGEDAPKGRWPWMAYLEVSDSKGHTYICGGSLINEAWVLTAAHCLYDREDAIVRLGTLSLQKPSEAVRTSSNFVIHPDYDDDDENFPNDIALLELDEEVDFSSLISPVTLPSAHDKNYQSDCWVTGWGNIAEDEDLPGKETLQQLKLPILSQSVCTDKYPDVSRKQFCAGFLKGGKDSCQGDSGGPLVCPTAGGGFVQRGITSFGDGCGKKGYPGVYTNVVKYLDFIDETLDEAHRSSV